MEIPEKDLPFRAEYAKTSRASCKACKTPIQQATIRLAVMVQVRNLFIKTTNRFTWLLYGLSKIHTLNLYLFSMEKKPTQK